MPAKNGIMKLLWRITGWLLVVFLGLVALVLVLMLIFRFINPPTTAFMVAHKLANPEQRIAQEWVSLDAISPWMPLAVVASEDQRFLQHRGLDLDAIRDAVDSYRRGGNLRGASTITQQTAKNLFLWEGRHFSRKLLEAGLATGLETIWSKARIMEVYLNVAEFGEGVYGVEAASQQFFGISARQLGPEQAALLASVLPSPKRMKVEAPSAYMWERVRWIRRQMNQLGGLDWVRRLE